MKRRKYITDAEHEKCKKVASVFSILEEDDIILLDVGRYGFVALFYYTQSILLQATDLSL
jgi:hypothetical protein